MSRPTCESMTARPSPNDGWSQWGVLSADGQTFTPLHGLESALPKESAYYYLAAAGICEIEGQPRAGARLPTEQPTPTPEGDLTPIASTVAEADPVAPVADATPSNSPPWVMGIGIVLVLIIGGAAFTRARRKQTDTTPQPKGFTFNQGGADSEQS
jgi:hypothetical protein